MYCAAIGRESNRIGRIYVVQGIFLFDCWQENQLQPAHKWLCGTRYTSTHCVKYPSNCPHQWLSVRSNLWGCGCIGNFLDPQMMSKDSNFKCIWSWNMLLVRKSCCSVASLCFLFLQWVRCIQYMFPVCLRPLLVVLFPVLVSAWDSLSCLVSDALVSTSCMKFF